MSVENKRFIAKFLTLYQHKGTLFFLAYLHKAGRRKKNEKKHTGHERVQFVGTTEHERGLTRTPHGKNSH